jgi:hypothetical protein
MSSCCDPCGCNDVFGPRFARHLASRYRKRGLDKTAARMVAYLVDRGVEGASVLEIGGGVGDIQLELLAQCASRTTNLELVDAYDADATELAETAGMRDRMIRRQVDIAATPEEVETHDIVVLPCQATAGIQPPTPQLGDPDVHPRSEGRFPTDGQVIPDVRPSPGGSGRHSGGTRHAHRLHPPGSGLADRRPRASGYSQSIKLEETPYQETSCD